MSDAAYKSSVRRALDDGWEDVNNAVRDNVADSVIAERIVERIANLVTAERALCDGDAKP